MGAAAVPIALAVTSGASLYGAYETMQGAKKARKEARTLADQQRDEQRRQEDELRKRKDIEATNAAGIASRNAMLRRGRDNAPYTRGGTILTSPLGLPGQSRGGGKTLLGA